VSARRRLGLTLRGQLTLLYAVPFLVSGALLLAIPLSQTSVSQPADGQQAGQFPGQSPGNEHAAHSMLVGSAIGLAVMTLLALLLGWLVAGRFLRPLRTITATARDISATNLHRRLGLRGRSNEFRQLGDTLDDLFGRLEAAFASQRTFIANASHELRTPLTAQRALLQVALADPDASADSLRGACQEVLLLGEQQARLIAALLTLATGERGIDARHGVDLADLAGRAVAARQDEAARRGVEVTTTLDPAPTAGDPHLLESLLVNLVDNAVRYNVPNGRVAVRTGTVDGRARLRVVNTGPVVPPGEVDRLFQPFQQLDAQRTRRDGGHGLGLAIVRAIATAHGATLLTRANPDGGLDIEVAMGGPGQRTGTGADWAVSFEASS
jgi:signal transduction histidine kinase